jgi:hypothetical protein
MMMMMAFGLKQDGANGFLVVLYGENKIRDIMWLIGFFGCFFIFGLLYLLFFDETVSESVGFGSAGALFVLVIFMIGYLCHSNENSEYELLYYDDVYCHLTNLNYTDERQLMIEAYRFPSRIEFEFSGQTYYRIDVSRSLKSVQPIDSYWIKSDNLEVVVADKVMPTFKRLRCKIDKNRPKIFDYFIPKFLMYEMSSEEKGILYLPKEPIYVYGEVPPFLELDFLEFTDNRDAGKYEEMGI